MHEIKELLMKELYDYEDKARKMSGGKLSQSELEHIHKLTDTVKNIDKIEMLEDDGYSEDGAYMGEGRIYGTSYARGRKGEHYVRGHYSRGEMPHHEVDGMSYAQRMRDSKGRYSRDGAKGYIVEQLEMMIREADTSKEREALERCLRAFENA